MKVCSELALAGSGQYGLSSRFDCSIWALRGDEGVVLIDAGSGEATEEILATVEADLNAPVVAALLTHSHADHARGLRSLRDRTGCRICVPEPSREAVETGDDVLTGLRTAREMGVYPENFGALACPVDETLRDGVEAIVAGLRFLPLHVRGHSQDHFCYLHDRMLFSGDAVFYGGVLGLINADGSDMAGYRADFGKLAGLDFDGLYPGHGLFTTRAGVRHIQAAAGVLRKGSLGRQIGQWDLIF